MHLLDALRSLICAVNITTSLRRLPTVRLAGRRGKGSSSALRRVTARYFSSADANSFRRSLINGATPASGCHSSQPAIISGLLIIRSHISTIRASPSTIQYAGIPSRWYRRDFTVRLARTVPG